jgi:hypothetical protein
LLSSGHSGITYNQDIDCLPLSGDLSYEISQLVVGSGSPGVFGCAESGGGEVLRQDDLHHEQLCAVAFSELGGPPDGPIGRFRTVGAHHDTSYGAVIVHNPYEFTDDDETSSMTIASIACQLLEQVKGSEQEARRFIDGPSLTFV